MPASLNEIDDWLDEYLKEKGESILKRMGPGPALMLSDEDLLFDDLRFDIRDTSFFTEIFVRKSRYYLKILLFWVLALVWNIGLYLLWNLPVPLQAYGVLLDIFGAVLVAKGLFRGKDGMLADAGIHAHVKRDIDETMYAIPPSDYFKQRLRSVAEDTVYGVWGTAFLIVGFIVQLVGLLRIHVPLTFGC